MLQYFVHHKNYFANKCLKNQNAIVIISDGHNKMVNVNFNVKNFTGHHKNHITKTLTSFLCPNLVQPLQFVDLLMNIYMVHWVVGSN